LRLYTSIADRVEAYYARSGMALTNYDTLTAAAADAQHAAQTQLASLTADSAKGLDCSQNDPRAAAASMVTDAKAEITALQNYRAAVKSLISNIQSVAK